MRIFRSIGLFIFLITILILMPKVFDEGQQTIISFLRGARLSADTASSIAASAATSFPAAGSTPRSVTALPNYPLPRVSSIPQY